MKLIITESQYNELNKVDDVYDGLDPYYRRRIRMINISDKIDEKIYWVLKNYYVKDIISDKELAKLIREIVRRLIWESRVWSPEWDYDKIDEYDDLMGNRIMDKYGDEIKRKTIEKLK